MNVSYSLMRGRQISESWRMLLCLLLAQLLVAFIGRSLGPLGVLIGEDLSLNNAQIGMLPAALFLGQALASIPVGFIADKKGSRKLLLIISSCVSLSFICITMSEHFILVLLLVGISGLGYGSMHPVTNRGIIYWFSLKQRGLAMGVKQTGITSGSALAGLLLLPLGASFGWRPVLFISCLLLFVGGLVSYIFYRDPVIPEEVNHKSQGFSPFFLTMAGMLKNKPLMLVSLSAMGLSGAQLCLVTYIVLYSYENLHISLFLSGILLVVSEISGSLGRIVWGIISDQLFKGNRVIVLIIITSLSAICSITLALLPTSTTFWVLLPIIVIFGFSVSGYNGIWMNLASEVVSPEYAGLSSGFSITLGSMGVILFPPLFGFIVDYGGSFTVGWFVIAVIMAVVLVLLSRLSIQLKNVKGTIS